MRIIITIIGLGCLLYVLAAMLTGCAGFVERYEALAPYDVTNMLEETQAGVNYILTWSNQDATATDDIIYSNGMVAASVHNASSQAILDSSTGTYWRVRSISPQGTSDFSNAVQTP